MKKAIFILLGLLLVVVAGLYIIVPRKIVISESIDMNASRAALLRKFAYDSSWHEWWPGTRSASDFPAIYELNGIRFRPGPIAPLSVPIIIDAREFGTVANLTFVSDNTDSTTLRIETSIAVSYNPFRRLGTYFRARTLEQSFSKMLQSIKNTYSSIVNLY